MYKYSLEKYRGPSSRYACPNCGARHQFVRYVDANRNHLSDEVGKCNRESKCGYHKKPREYFAENPTVKTNNIRSGITTRAQTRKQRFAEPNCEIQVAKELTDYVPSNFLIQTIRNYERNDFIRFLQILFPDKIESVENAIKDYRIGTTQDGRTVFWQIDRKRRVRTGKIIAYDAHTGKRQKDVNPNWVHAELKRAGRLKQDFKLKQCFFGEHLLSVETGKTVGVVEAEKTAVICSILYTEVVWVAIGAKGYLTDQRLQLFAGREVLLFPDADAYLQWKEKAVKGQRNGLNVRVSALIESLATSSEKENGFDLADYLINEQIDQMERNNEFADRYNAKLEKVLNDDNLFDDFETILEEQKSILMISGGFSDADAERLVTDLGNLREIVMSV